MKAVQLSVHRINRNIVECKGCCTRCCDSPNAGINRNIVECKADWCFRRIHCTFCINRNIVECKERTPFTPEQVDAVIIETLWNVK